MRFRRRHKLEAFEWTVRKRAMFEQRGERERARLASAYPLIHEHLPCHNGVTRTADEEAARRAASMKATEQDMRDFVARTWRQARRAYFACPADTRRSIKQEWQRWPGPAEANYFLYVVEKHNGAAEVRRIRIRDAEEVFHKRHGVDDSAQGKLRF